MSNTVTLKEDCDNGSSISKEDDIHLNVMDESEFIELSDIVPQDNPLEADFNIDIDDGIELGANVEILQNDLHLTITEQIDEFPNENVILTPNNKNCGVANVETNISTESEVSVKKPGRPRKKKSNLNKPKKLRKRNSQISYDECSNEITEDDQIINDSLNNLPKRARKGYRAKKTLSNNLQNASAIEKPNNSLAETFNNFENENSLYNFNENDNGNESKDENVNKKRRGCSLQRGRPRKTGIVTNDDSKDQNVNKIGKGRGSPLKRGRPRKISSATNDENESKDRIVNKNGKHQGDTLKRDKPTIEGNIETKIDNIEKESGIVEEGTFNVPNEINTLNASYKASTCNAHNEASILNIPDKANLSHISDKENNSNGPIDMISSYDSVINSDSDDNDISLMKLKEISGSMCNEIKVTEANEENNQEEIVTEDNSQSGTSLLLEIPKKCRKRNSKKPMMPDFEYNIDDLLKSDKNKVNTVLNNEKSEENNLVHSEDGRPLRQKARQKYYDENSDEDPFANVESSDSDTEKTYRKGYYSDDEYIPRGLRSPSSDSAVDEQNVVQSKQKKKCFRKKSELQSPTKSSIKAGSVKKNKPELSGTEDPDIVIVATDTTKNDVTDNDIENCLDSSVITTKTGLENLLGNKVIGKDIQIKKVLPMEGNSTGITPLKIPVLDPNKLKETIEMSSQTTVLNLKSTSVQTSSPYAIKLKNDATLSGEQSENACVFLKNILTTTSELGELMCQKSDEFITKKINTGHIKDTTKIDYCINKAFLLFKLAKDNLTSMEETLGKQYETFLSTNNLMSHFEMEQSVTPTVTNTISSDSDCEIVEEPVVTKKPKFNAKTVFLNKELSIKIAKKSNVKHTQSEKIKPKAKGLNSVWINDSIMVKKVKPQQSFLAQDGRFKKPPDYILEDIVKDFFNNYYKSLICTPFTSLDWLDVNKQETVCNYFFLQKPVKHPSCESSEDDGFFDDATNSGHLSIELNDNDILGEPVEEQKIVIKNPSTLFALCTESLYKLLKFKSTELQEYDDDNVNTKSYFTLNKSTVTSKIHLDEVITIRSLKTLCYKKVVHLCQMKEKNIHKKEINGYSTSCPKKYESILNTNQSNKLKSLTSLCLEIFQNLFPSQIIHENDVTENFINRSTIDNCNRSIKFTNVASLKALCHERICQLLDMRKQYNMFVETCELSSCKNLAVMSTVVKSLKSLCCAQFNNCEQYNRNDSVLNNNYNNPHTLKRISYENVTYLLYSNNTNNHSSKDCEIIINHTNKSCKIKKLFDLSFNVIIKYMFDQGSNVGYIDNTQVLNGYSINDMESVTPNSCIETNDNYLEDDLFSNNDLEDNNDLDGYFDEQTENVTWNEEIEGELNSCFQPVIQEVHSERPIIEEVPEMNEEPNPLLITHIKVEPSEILQFDNNLNLKDEPIDENETNIVIDSVEVKREIITDYNYQTINSGNIDNFEEFLRGNKIAQTILTGSSVPIYTQSNLRIRMQFEPDSDGEEEMHLSNSLLIPQASESVINNSAKGSLMENSEEKNIPLYSKKNRLPKRKKCVRKKSSLEAPFSNTTDICKEVRMQFEPDSDDEEEMHLSNSLLIPQASEPVINNSAKGSLMESSEEENIPLYSRKNRLPKRKECVPKNSSLEVPFSTTTDICKEKVAEKQIDRLTRKMKDRIRNNEKATESSDSEIDCSPLSKIKIDARESNSGIVISETLKSNLLKDNDIQCNSVDSTQKINEDIETNYEEITFNNENVRTDGRKKTAKFDNVSSIKQTMPKVQAIEDNTKISEKEHVPIIATAQPENLKVPAHKTVDGSKIELNLKSDNVDSHMPVKVTKRPFTVCDGWECYQIDVADTKIHQACRVVLHKLPQVFVNTYFKYTNMNMLNDGNDKTDMEINRLTDLRSLNRVTNTRDNTTVSNRIRERTDKDNRNDSDTDSANYSELLPSDDEHPVADQAAPLFTKTLSDSTLAKDSLMSDNESDPDVSHDDKDDVNKSKQRLSKVPVTDNPESLVLTADKMMKNELELLHAPVVLNNINNIKTSSKQSSTNRHTRKKSITNNNDRDQDLVKSEDDYSSEEEKLWVNTKERLLRKVKKKIDEGISADDAKRIKMVNEFLGKRSDDGMSSSRVQGRSRRSLRNLLEREKQLRVLTHELIGGEDPSKLHILPGKKGTYHSNGRRNIRKVLDKKSLAINTVVANMEEFERKKRISQTQIKMREVLGYEEGVNAVVINEELCLEYDFEQMRPVVSVHPFFTKVMKAHQCEGVKFMWDACFESLQRIESGHAGGGCLLAHCMGLGKTLQVLALVHAALAHPRVGARRVLVVCPLSTVLNWVDEINKWLAPVDDYIKVFELSKLKKLYEKAYQLEDWYKGGGIFIIGYELFRSLSTLDHIMDKIRPTIVNKIRTALLDPGPDIIVCDEGHLLKNDSSVLAVAMSRVQTKRRIVLTGTPMQNNLREYYCMVNFVKPNLLGTYSEYSNRFENPIMNGQHRDSREEDIKLMKTRTHILHKVLEGCLQRQEVSVLYPYLPKKYEYTMFIGLTDCQVQLYKHYLDEFTNKTKQNIFKDFHMLQKIWSHPQVLHNFLMRSRKNANAIDKDEKLEDDLAQEDLASEDIKPNATEVWWLQYLEGGNQLDTLETSNKFVTVFKILKECVQVNDKVLLFSTSLFTLDALEYFLKKINKWSLGQEYYRLDGSVPTEVRQKWCREFNADNNQNTKLFLISTRAGSLGLNMTGANRVILLDTSWNPAHDIQSIFRVYRFGQKKDCYIYRLVAMGTMEQKIYERSVTKQAVACRVVDEQQIDRHYNMAELAELYRFDHLGESIAAGVAASVRDVVLLRVARGVAALHAVHEHDSLLRGETEQQLPEHERAAAWDLFQQEQHDKQMQGTFSQKIKKLQLKKAVTCEDTRKSFIHDSSKDLIKSESLVPDMNDPENIPQNVIKRKHPKKTNDELNDSQNQSQSNLGSNEHLNKDEIQISNSSLDENHDFQGIFSQKIMKLQLKRAVTCEDTRKYFINDSSKDLIKSVSLVPDMDDPEYIPHNVVKRKRPKKTNDELNDSTATQNQSQSNLSSNEQLNKDEIQISNSSLDENHDFQGTFLQKIKKLQLKKAVTCEDTRKSFIHDSSKDLIKSVSLVPDMDDPEYIPQNVVKRKRPKKTNDELNDSTATQNQSQSNLSSNEQLNKDELQISNHLIDLSKGVQITTPDINESLNDNVQISKSSHKKDAQTSKSSANEDLSKGALISKISKILLKHNFQNNLTNTSVSKLAKSVTELITTYDISEQAGNKKREKQADHLANNIANMLMAHNIDSLPVKEDDNVTRTNKRKAVDLEDNFTETIVEHPPQTSTSKENKHVTTLKPRKSLKSSSNECHIIDDDIVPLVDISVPENIKRGERETKRKKIGREVKDRKRIQHETNDRVLINNKGKVMETIQTTSFEPETLILSDDGDDVIDVNQKSSNITSSAVQDSDNPIEIDNLTVDQTNGADDDNVPLHPVLLTNQHFIKIVAHTFQKRNPDLDERSATLAATYSASKELEEIKDNKKKLQSGTIYDIAVKVLGKPALRALWNTIAVTEIDNIPTMFNIHKTNSVPNQDESATNPQTVSIVAALTSSPTLVPIVAAHTSSMNVQPSVVPITLIKNTDVSRTAGECILPDNDTPVRTASPTPIADSVTHIYPNNLQTQTTDEQNFKLVKVKIVPKSKIPSNANPIRIEALPKGHNRTLPSEVKVDTTICLDSDDETATPAIKVKSVKAQHNLSDTITPITIPNNVHTKSSDKVAKTLKTTNKNQNILVDTPLNMNRGTQPPGPLLTIDGSKLETVLQTPAHPLLTLNNRNYSKQISLNSQGDAVNKQLKGLKAIPLTKRQINPSEVDNSTLIIIEDTTENDQRQNCNNNLVTPINTLLIEDVVKKSAPTNSNNIVITPINILPKIINDKKKKSTTHTHTTQDSIKNKKKPINIYPKSLINDKEKNIPTQDSGQNMKKPINIHPKSLINDKEKNIPTQDSGQNMKKSIIIHPKSFVNDKEKIIPTQDSGQNMKKSITIHPKCLVNDKEKNIPTQDSSKNMNIPIKKPSILKKGNNSTNNTKPLVNLKGHPIILSEINLDSDDENDNREVASTMTPVNSSPSVANDLLDVLKDVVIIQADDFDKAKRKNLSSCASSSTNVQSTVTSNQKPPTTAQPANKTVKKKKLVKDIFTNDKKLLDGALCAMVDLTGDNVKVPTAAHKQLTNLNDPTPIEIEDYTVKKQSKNLNLNKIVDKKSCETKCFNEYIKDTKPSTSNSTDQSILKNAKRKKVTEVTTTSKKKKINVPMTLKDFTLDDLEDIIELE